MNLLKNNLERLVNDMSPGNYWLTKSMEFNRISSSGTLWYLKKWIVYYYYIFMRNTSLYAQDYNEIVEIFNNYIKLYIKIVLIIFTNK